MSSFKTIGKPGGGNKLASGVMVLFYEGKANIANQPIFSPVGYGTNAIYRLPKNTKFNCFVPSWSFKEQSYNWSAGAADFRFYVRDVNSGYLFDQTYPVVEGTAACDIGNNNVEGGGGYFKENIDIETTNIFNVGCFYDSVNVITPCVEVAKFTLYFSFPSISLDQITEDLGLPNGWSRMDIK